MPSLQGISHVSLTVPDMDRAKRFWTTVMGLEVAGAATGTFDETRVGMDHIALAVPSVVDLEEWTAWLDQHDVEHSDVVESDLGHHLHLRAPDRIAVELFVRGTRWQPRSASDEPPPAWTGRRSPGPPALDVRRRPLPASARRARRARR